MHKASEGRDARSRREILHHTSPSFAESPNQNENFTGNWHNGSKLVTSNNINLREALMISKGLMFHTLLLTCFRWLWTSFINLGGDDGEPQGQLEDLKKKKKSCRSGRRAAWKHFWVTESESWAHDKMEAAVTVELQRQMGFGECSQPPQRQRFQLKRLVRVRGIN